MKSFHPLSHLWRWGQEKTPEALENFFAPPGTPTSSVSSLCPLPQLCAPSTARPGPSPWEALPAEASRGLICCHLISICCTWELSLDRDLGRKGGGGGGVAGREGEALEPGAEGLGAGPVLLLPGQGSAPPGRCSHSGGLFSRSLAKGR